MAFATPLLHFTLFKRLKLIRQTEAAECGLACLAMIAGWHGLDTDMTSLRRRFPVSIKGATLEDLIATASALDLTTRALRCDPEDFGQIRLPAILHWEFKHFVVLAKVTSNHAIIYDPALGERKVALRDLDKSFTGVVLELAPASAFVRRRERTPLDLFNLIRFTPDVVKALAQGFALSVLLKVFVILSPFYMQLVVDEDILRSSGSNRPMTGRTDCVKRLLPFRPMQKSLTGPIGGMAR